MLVSDIIKAVRLCIDEEDSNPSSLANQGVLGSDNALMDNIIKGKIGDAIRWICLYTPSDLLGGSDETTTEGGQTVPVDTGILVDVTEIPSAIGDTNAGKLTMPNDFVKLARVRVDGWHRAVKELLTEDSDEYLQLYDTNGATATVDRPQAVLIEKSTREIEVWPIGSPANYTYVANVDPEEHAIKDETTHAIIAYPLPPRVKTSFIYYIAFLLLTAYGDARSEKMLEIAMHNLNVSKKQ